MFIFALTTDYIGLFLNGNLVIFGPQLERHWAEVSSYTTIFQECICNPDWEGSREVLTTAFRQTDRQQCEPMIQDVALLTVASSEASPLIEPFSVFTPANQNMFFSL